MPVAAQMFGDGALSEMTPLVVCQLADICLGICGLADTTFYSVEVVRGGERVAKIRRVGRKKAGRVVASYCEYGGLHRTRTQETTLWTTT